MGDNEITLEDLVVRAFDGLSDLMERYDLPLEKSSVAAFSIVYGVNTPDGDIEVNHATPVDFRMDTPIVLERVAKILHEENVSKIAENN